MRIASQVSLWPPTRPEPIYVGLSMSASVQRNVSTRCVERVTPGYRGATELREMLRILHAGEELRVNSLEGPYHAWTFVEDVAEAVERAWATPSLPNDIYTITC